MLQLNCFSLKLVQIFETLNFISIGLNGWSISFSFFTLFQLMFEILLPILDSFFYLEEFLMVSSLILRVFLLALYLSLIYINHFIILIFLK